jgi:hypothetical protein
MGVARTMTKAEMRVNACAALFTLSLLASPAVAQTAGGLSHVDDATTAPKGFLRLRVLTAWTRYDSRFTADSSLPLGAPFTSDAFGSETFQPLSTIESLVQSASGAPIVLNLGRARLDATAREEVIPLSLEYGITRRLSVHATVPIWRKRVAALFRLDTAGGFTANVGPNVHRTSTSAATNNQAVQTEFGAAAQQLQNLLTSCAANPSGPGCSSVVGREAQAQQLIQSSQAFANAVEQLYGSTASTGMAFVPTTQSAAQGLIALRVVDFNSEYRDFLGSGTDVLTAVPQGAGGIAGPSPFQSYLSEDLGRDSLISGEWVGFGDIELGARFSVIDRPRTPQSRTGIQLVVAAGLRLPTGSQQSLSDIVDMRLGEGEPVVEAKAITDIRVGRVGVLAAGHFAAKTQGAQPVIPGLPAPNTAWTEISVAPRWHLSEPFSLHGAYSLRTADADGTDHLVGGGFSFTNLALFRGTGTAPIEMRFTHLEALRGAAGRPKFFRDQLEVRIYFRLLR